MEPSEERWADIERITERIDNEAARRMGDRPPKTGVYVILVLIVLLLLMIILGLMT